VVPDPGGGLAVLQRSEAGAEVLIPAGVLLNHRRQLQERLGELVAGLEYRARGDLGEIEVEPAQVVAVVRQIPGQVQDGPPG
jgi:hypothetical protein